MNNNIYDVIVVGGGPSGLQTAYLLSGSGYNVALFEKDPQIGLDVVCSGVMSKEAFERYDLPKDSIASTLRNADLYSPSGKHINYEHPEASVVVVDRYKFDTMLATRAVDNGTTVHLSTRIKKLIPEQNRVKVIASTNNINTIYEAKLVVIATGISFNLQDSVGLGRPEKIIKGIQVEIPSISLDKLKMFWGNDISRGFFGWAIPLDDGRARIGVMSLDSPLRGLNNIVSNLNLERLFREKNPRIRRRGISHGMINKRYGNRILAVGEAGGLVKTTTGGGIYYGLISADYAARVIDRAFKLNTFDESVLSQYDHYLNKEFSREISMGKHFHNFYSNLSDTDIDTLFDAAVKDGLLTHVAREGRFDWHTNTIYRIIRSSNLRRALLKGIIQQGMNKLALTS